jgi:8-oxo-dGTP pyrophosphatase MutT (NUDIX family)
MPEPATPNPASTVVLVRPEAGGGVEVFMNRRPPNMETYAGAYVFPGGRLEADDGSEEMLRLMRGLSPAQAQEFFGAELKPEFCLAHWVAAIRELFEEAGVHFFVDATGKALPAGRQKLLARKRAALQRGELSFLNLLQSEQLHCDVSSLVYFFHRVTPEHYAIRFDTRFYMAALPPGQAPIHYSEEVAESLWINAGEALDRFAGGRFPLMPPTIAVLRTLLGHRSWRDLAAAFRLGFDPLF